MPPIRKTAILGMLMAAIMFGFGFALVPLYNVFCQVTGLNGKIDLGLVSGLPNGVISDRIVTVEFDVNHNLGMPWHFKPQQAEIKVHPGAIVKTGYIVTNPTQRTMMAQAIPSISPSIAAAYLKKVECFCFNEQKLEPGETANLSLQFYLDPKIPESVKRLTLSYTLFDRSIAIKHDC